MPQTIRILTRLVRCGRDGYLLKSYVVALYRYPIDWDPDRRQHGALKSIPSCCFIFWRPPFFQHDQNRKKVPPFLPVSSGNRVRFSIYGFQAVKVKKSSSKQSHLVKTATRTNNIEQQIHLFRQHASSLYLLNIDNIQCRNLLYYL